MKKVCAAPVQKVDRRERYRHEDSDDAAHAEGNILSYLTAEQEGDTVQNDIDEQQRPQDLQSTGPQHLPASLILILQPEIHN
jgi:hypothetical protein